MTLSKLPVQSLDDPQHRRRHREVTNLVLTHQHDDSRVQTTAEKLAGITPVNYAYPPGDVRRYKGGSLAVNGTEDWSSAFNTALSVDQEIHIYQGHYLGNNLVQTKDFQRIYAHGEVKITKNANGPLFTSTGDYVDIHGIGFRGDASSPTFTGDGIVLEGDHPRLFDCGARWISGVPLKATGAHVQIIGTCDIYQTTDTADTAYDIEIGESGTATLYHQITNVYTSHATGGIKFIDCGGQAVVGCQFGKLTIEAGTSPAGVNGGTYACNRINGDVLVEISSSSFSSCSFSGDNIEFVSGTSGHAFDRSNVMQASLTLTDSSTESVVEDSRLVPYQSYTPSWTAASVNPAIGNGTIVGRFSKKGREVTVFIKITMGSTTTFGTGAYSFSLPYTPSTTLECMGTAFMFDSGTNFRIGVARSLSTGVAACQVYYDTAVAGIGPTTPFTWANGDALTIGLTYFTN